MICGIMIYFGIQVTTNTHSNCRMCRDIVRASERYEMYDVDFKSDMVLNGLYWPSDKFYCVWVGNRTNLDHYDTDTHEQCHAMVDLEWKHFCNYTYEK